MTTLVFSQRWAAWIFVGVFLAAAEGRAGAAVSDLCAPCDASNPQVCTTGLCVGDPNNGYPNICSQPCGANSDCPSNFSCKTFTAVDGSGQVACKPNNTLEACKTAFVPPGLNGQCQFMDSTGAVIVPGRSCASDLICTMFPGAVGGYCIQACTASQGVGACESGYSCCFGLDGTSGACLPASANVSTTGGCFQNLQVGDNCSAYNARVCPGDSKCLYLNASSNMHCYNLCGSNSNGGTCNSREICVALNSSTNSDPTTGASSSVSLCCDVSQYSSSDPTSCVPAPDCIRELGVVCTRGSDCRTGLCAHNSKTNQMACSISCQTDQDCAAISRGGSCQTLGANQICWPKQGPNPVPACAASASAAPSSSGGGCQAEGREGGAWLTLALGLGGLSLGWRRRRRSLG